MSAPLALRVARVGGYDGPLPAHQTPGAAGLDLCAAMPWPLDGFTVQRVPTGIAVEIPPGHVGLIRGRSGLASRTVLVVEGTIDSDYRGEVSVMMHTLGAAYEVTAGQRIAQLVIVPYVRCDAVEVPLHELSVTERGVGGFGSTGAA